MDRVYRNFYRNCYLRTGGFIPTEPLNTAFYPGDFFQIVNGQMVMLGNIFRNGIVEAVETSFGRQIRHNPSSWVFSDGLSKPYSGRGTGHGPIVGEFEFSKQLLAFEARGSFLFKGNDPQSVKIQNWAELQQQLIIKMTQTIYSFRELYVVTESVTLSDWTLAVAGAPKADLEIATDTENFGLVDIFGHHSAKTIQSKDIEYHHRETGGRPCFFRAKKLVLQDEKLDVFISELIDRRESHHEWAGSFFRYDLPPEPGYLVRDTVTAKASVLDMMQSNQLNPNTALLYFRWSDVSLDDVEKFFQTYGY